MGLSSFDIFCFFGEREEAMREGKPFWGRDVWTTAGGKGWEWVSHSKVPGCWSVDMASGSTEVSVGVA